MTGYALDPGPTGVDLEEWSQPELTPSDASIYPKPDRIVSGLSPRIEVPTVRRPKPTSGLQPRLKKGNGCTTTSLVFVPKEEVGRIFRSFADTEASLESRKAFGLRADSWLEPKRQLESARGAESLPPTILFQKHRGA
jgi:hypothetical protein